MNKPRPRQINRLKIAASESAATVTAPDGRVLEEFKIKRGKVDAAFSKACTWASGTTDFVSPSLKQPPVIFFP